MLKDKLRERWTGSKLASACNHLIMIMTMMVMMMMMVYDDDDDDDNDDDDVEKGGRDQNSHRPELSFGLKILHMCMYT